MHHQMEQLGDICLEGMGFRLIDSGVVAHKRIPAQDSAPGSCDPALIWRPNLNKKRAENFKPEKRKISGGAGAVMSGSAYGFCAGAVTGPLAIPANGPA